VAIIVTFTYTLGFFIFYLLFVIIIPHFTQFWRQVRGGALGNFLTSGAGLGLGPIWGCFGAVSRFWGGDGVRVAIWNFVGMWTVSGWGYGM
jgi:hypothetical protein